MKYLKLITLIVVAFIFLVSPVFAANYCLVENGEIIKGPMKLPDAWGNTSGLNHCDAVGLKARGWLPYVPGMPSAHDKATQYLTFVNVVGEDSVTRDYTINQYTQEQLDELAAEAARKQKIVDAKEVMTLSDLANITYAQIATHVENTFPNLTPAQRVSLTKLDQIVLAGLKRNYWS